MSDELTRALIDRIGRLESRLAHLESLETAPHDVTAKHTVTGDAMQVVGLTAEDTLGLLTPSSDPGAASKVLKSDADGKLELVGASLSGQGSSHGLSIGGDTQLYRSAADVLRTPDSLVVDTALGIATGGAPTTKLEVSGGFVTADGIGKYKGCSTWSASQTKTIVTDLPTGLYQVTAVATDPNWYLVAWVRVRAGTGSVVGTLYSGLLAVGFSGDDLQLTNTSPGYAAYTYWVVTQFDKGS